VKVSEIVSLSGKELEEKLKELKKDLFFLRMQHATNQLDNPLQIAHVKKDIARVKTVIRRQQITQGAGG
jgi:large subunit ribosomal protein L29